MALCHYFATVAESLQDTSTIPKFEVQNLITTPQRSSDWKGVVMKFGGTSVQDASAIEQVVEIIGNRYVCPPVIVISAMAGVTNTLLQLAKTASERRIERVIMILAQLQKRHLKIAQELLAGSSQTELLNTVEQRIENLFAELELLVLSVAVVGELSPCNQDAIVSFGEQLSSLLATAALLAHGIPAKLVDARQFMITDAQFTQAEPNLSQIQVRAQALLIPILESGQIPVTQGFLGSTAEGVTTTLGRGGSDYSAALIGAVLEASAIEIWTDVDGLMTADPRVVAAARRLRTVSSEEAAELARFGAKVLHPDTMEPALQLGIPIYIFNTNRPECEGTAIEPNLEASSPLIKSIAFKRDTVLVTISAKSKTNPCVFLYQVFEILNRHRISVDVTTTSQASVTLVIETADDLEILKQDLSQIGTLTVEPRKALICLVGNQIKSKPGITAQIFNSLKEFRVDLICHGASEQGSVLVVDDHHVSEVVRRLHQEFFTQVDTEIFA